VAYVGAHGRDAAGSSLGRDQCVEQGTVVGTVTRGLDDHVLVDAQELAEGEELILPASHGVYLRSSA